MTQEIQRVTNGETIKHDGDLTITEAIEDGATIIVTDGNLTVRNGVKIGKEVHLQTVRSQSKDDKSCNVFCYSEPGSGAYISSDNVIFLNACNNETQLFALHFVRVTFTGSNCTIKSDGDVLAGVVYDDTTISAAGSVTVNDIHKNVKINADKDIHLNSYAAKNSKLNAKRDIHVRGYLGISCTVSAGNNLYMEEVFYNRDDLVFKIGNEIHLFEDQFAVQPVRIITPKPSQKPKKRLTLS